MKNKVVVYDAIALIVLSYASLFKILHWPGGNVFLLLSLGIMVPIALLITAAYLTKEGKKLRK